LSARKRSFVALTVVAMVRVAGSSSLRVAAKAWLRRRESLVAVVLSALSMRLTARRLKLHPIAPTRALLPALILTGLIRYGKDHTAAQDTPRVTQSTRTYSVRSCPRLRAEPSRLVYASTRLDPTVPTSPASPLDRIHAYHHRSTRLLLPSPRPPRCSTGWSSTTSSPIEASRPCSCPPPAQ
jgi:hypothetical protein